MKVKITTTIITLLLLNYSFSQEFAKVGEKAPPLKFEYLKTSDGIDKSINDLNEKLLILDFWGTWCGPCIKGFSHLNELVEIFKDEPVQFISVGYENTERARQVLEKHKVKAWRATDTDLSVFTDYDAWTIPLVYIIDKKGWVKAKIHPEDLTIELIRLALKGNKIQDPDPNAAPYPDPEGAKEHFLSSIKN